MDTGDVLADVAPGEKIVPGRIGVNSIHAAARPAARIPAEPGIWVLVGGDLLLFGLFFGTYAYYRGDDPGVYAAGQALLDRHIGFANTLLLLTGSWLVASAVTHVAEIGPSRAGRLFGVAGLTGLGFVTNKAYEWGALFADGVSIYTNDFFMFYFMFSGIHALHVVLGVGVLTYFCVRMHGRESELPSQASVEGAGIFWHLVDLLWIVLFALFYLANHA